MKSGGDGGICGVIVGLQGGIKGAGYRALHYFVIFSEKSVTLFAS